MTYSAPPYAYAPPTPPPPRRPGIGLRIGLVIAGVVAGIAAGWVAAGLIAAPSTPSQSGTLPAVPAAFPGNHRYLDGAVASKIRSGVESQGYRCRTEANSMKIEPEYKNETDCYLGNLAGQRVVIYWDADDRVTRLSAHCEVSVKDTRECDQFFVNFTGLGIDDPAALATAQKWVVTNSHSDAVTQVGTLDLALTLDGDFEIRATG